MLLIYIILMLTSIVDANIINCLSDSNVPQDVPGSASFDQDIVPYNLRLPYTPRAYAIPFTIPQVKAAVKCASKYDLKVNPRSGGHSYASHGIGGENGHLVIDLKHFNDVVVDDTTNVASIGPGARLGNVAIALFEQGERAISHGVCPGVGVGGHATVGGWGYSSRTHGLFTDALIEATVVLADGSVVVTSEKENSELFWGMRGGGCSFGIAVDLKFRTMPAPAGNILFYYVYLWNATQAVQGYEAFQFYGDSTACPTEMNIRFVISSVAGTLGWVVEGVYHGDEAAFEKAILPLLSNLGTPLISYNKTYGWLDALLYANNNDLLFPLLGFEGTHETLEKPLNYTDHGNFFNKSLFSPALSQSAIAAFVSWLETTATQVIRPWFVIVLLVGGPTSAISLISNAATAYPHRNSLLSYEFSDAVALNATYQASFTSFLDSGVASIVNAMPGTKFGEYYGYADPTLKPKQAHEGYWGENYMRLVKLKRKVDPRNLFKNPQSVQG